MTADTKQPARVEPPLSDDEQSELGQIVAASTWGGPGARLRIASRVGRISDALRQERTAVGNLTSDCTSLLIQRNEARAEIAARDAEIAALKETADTLSESHDEMLQSLERVTADKMDQATEIAELKADLARLRAEQEWRPIETAEKRDGEPFIGCIHNERMSGYVDQYWWSGKRGWTNGERDNVPLTHFRPLPSPPTEKKA